MALTAMAAFALAEVLLFPLWGDNEEVDCAADAASWGPAVDELHAVVPELSVVPVAPGLVDVALNLVGIGVATFADVSLVAESCAVVALLRAGVRDWVEADTTPENL